MGKRDIALRIKSVKEVRKITRAMYLISASKFQKAKGMLDRVRPYYYRVQAVMKDILLHTGEVTSRYLESRDVPEKEDKKKVFLIITGDKGLCGAYNHNVIKAASDLIKNERSNLKLIGEVGRRYFVKKGYDVDLDFYYNVQNPTVDLAAEIADILLKEYNNGDADEIWTVYTEMKGLSQKVRTLRLLPLDVENFMTIAAEEEEAVEEPVTIDSDMIYEPSPSEVFDAIVPEYLKGLIYSILVQAFASEHFSRMVAMDRATNNADDMIDKLTLLYNKVRQASITQEIIEIITGASV
ncbi:ATP synthase F1 subunit gamma [Caldanaerobacter sp.]|uniref:ATP synthase F1 subunit gamma n=1 Tax=Caldanaerobacter sp. TaxID=2930036 RepID=UPI003C724CE6